MFGSNKGKITVSPENKLLLSIIMIERSVGLVTVLLFLSSTGQLL